MPPKLRRACTFANVTSLLALFVALSGTAYAVGKLTPEAVKSRHIANGALRGHHIPAGVIDPMKIGGHTVFSKLSDHGQPRVAGPDPIVETNTVTSTESYENVELTARCRQDPEHGISTVTPSTTVAPNPVLHLAGYHDESADLYWNTATITSKNTDGDNRGVTVELRAKRGGGTAWLALHCTHEK